MASRGIVAGHSQSALSLTTSLAPRDDAPSGRAQDIGAAPLSKTATKLLDHPAKRIIDWRLPNLTGLLPVLDRKVPASLGNVGHKALFEPTWRRRLPSGSATTLVRRSYGALRVRTPRH